MKTRTVLKIFAIVAGIVAAHYFFDFIGDSDSENIQGMDAAVTLGVVAAICGCLSVMYPKEG